MNWRMANYPQCQEIQSCEGPSFAKFVRQQRHLIHSVKNRKRFIIKIDKNIILIFNLRRCILFKFGRNGNSIENISSKRIKILCLCGTIISVPLTPTPFNCENPKCDIKYIRDKDEIFRIIEMTFLKIVTA